MRGKITRLLACSPEELATYKGMDIGPTFVHPNYRHNPINGDVSASYNKPASVMHFSRESNFTEDFLLFIDADMLLVRDIDPLAFGAKPGTVVSEEVGYMIGARNAMARNFLSPEAVPLAKPVGWYHIFHRTDILRIAPLWLEFCGKVRTMPELYWSINGSIPRDIPTGDAYVARGKAPWISEMYGYSFGAATAGVQHVVTHDVVQYPRDSGGSLPYILHYGIDFDIGESYNWNKMVYKKLDISKCQGRFFGVPPKPRNKREESGALVVNTLNRAFCRYYATHCPDTAAPCPPTEQPPGGGLVRCSGEGPCCEDKQTACWCAPRAAARVRALTMPWRGRLRLQGVGLRLQRIGLRLQGVGLRLQGVGLRLQSVGLRLQGVGPHGCRVRAYGCRACVPTVAGRGPSTSSARRMRTS